jgi:hypothetical protein
MKEEPYDKIELSLCPGDIIGLRNTGDGRRS